MKSEQTETCHQAIELNQVLVSGQIVSRIHRYPNKIIFTLANPQGRFFVQWTSPDWKPQQGQQVMVRGSLFSVFGQTGNAARIRAAEICLLGTIVEDREV
jgi:hypothetical protein